MCSVKKGVLKKGVPQDKCFPVKSVTFLRTSIWKNICERRFSKV